jgi:hypothetical protein
METLALLAGLTSVLTCWIVGARLLSLGRRTRRTPELLIGLGLLLVGGFWSPLVAVGRQATGLPDPLRAAFVVAGALCAIAGVGSLALFNWRVFRPAPWAGALAAVVSAALVACFAAQSLAPGWLHYARDERGPWIGATWVAVANYAWANLESWRQYRMLARRKTLGLADPVVTDRMRLWAMALLASLLATATAAVCQSLGIPVGGTAFGLWLSAVAAVSASACLWLAFLPPAAYLARVRRRAAAA